ncbi:hypothetical protein LIT25_27315 (plasmid) [Bacillus sp. F19]|nr:hypothetical protein LIT25_27315 [Bacillus sp. F19]
MNKSPKLIINRLVLVGHDKDYIVPFSAGINIIYGDSDTGKSSILNLINYLLGSSEVYMYDEIELKAKYALLEVSLNENIYTIKRNIFNSNEFIEVFKSNLEEIDTVFPLEYGPNYQKQGSSGFFSDFLLSSLNIPLIKVKEAPTKVESPMKRVSFRDIFKYNYLEQDDVGNKNILDLQNWAVRIKNQETFKLIHNLLDDQITQLEEEIAKKTSQKNKSDNEFKIVSSFFSDTKLQSIDKINEYIIELDIQLNALVNDIETITTNMKSDNIEIDEIRENIIYLEKEIDKLNKEKFFKKTQLDRSISLKKDYKIDISKLQSAIEISEKFPKNINDEVKCPICNNSLVLNEGIDHQHTNESILIEIRTLKSRVKELDKLIDNIRSSIFLMEKEQEEFTSRLIKIRNSLDNSLSNFISPYISHRDALISEKSSIIEKKQQYTYMLKLRRKLEDIDLNSYTLSEQLIELKKELDVLKDSKPSPKNVLENVENILKEFLEFIPIKNPTGININEKTFLPIVRNREYTKLTSGGLRTLVSVGYFLSLLVNSLNTKTNLPSLLMIDTIGKYLGKTKEKYMSETDDREDKQEQMNDPTKYLNMYKFFIKTSEELLKDDKIHQIIIVDNDVPSEIEQHLMGYIVKRFSHDRKPGFEVGLIDDI